MARSLAYGNSSTGQYGSTASLSHGIGTGAFTWCCWAYPTTLGTSNCMYSNGSFSPSIYTHYQTSHWACYFNGAHDFGTNPSLNTWQHFCLSRSGSTWTGYYNGTADGSTFTDSSSVPNAIQYLAMDNTGGQWGLAGRMAEMALWKAALSVSEIKALAAGILPCHIQPTSLVGYWPLWGIHSPEIDLSTNRKTITLSNTPPQATHAPVQPFSRRWWSVSDYGGAPPTYTEASGGGARAGGTAALAVVFPLATQGGGRSGAPATLAATFAATTQGGGRAGSVAALAGRFAFSASGGGRAGTTTAFAVSYALAGQGGIRAGSVVAATATYPFVDLSGGGRAGGSSEWVIAYPISGGARAGGMADATVTFVLQATGGGRAGAGADLGASVYTESTVGGARAGSQANLAVTYACATTGGARPGGLVAPAAVYTVSVRGGARAGSMLSGTLVFPGASGGGARAGGQAAFGIHYGVATAGGARAGSAAGMASRFVVTVAGGARTGGATVPYRIFASGGARAGGVAEVGAVFSVDAYGGARGGAEANLPTKDARGGARSGGRADLLAAFALEASGGARAGGETGSGFQVFERLAVGGARAGSDPGPILSFTIFSGMLWTFNPAAFAGLWTFRPGTFSGIGKQTRALILDGWKAPDAGLLWKGEDSGLVWRGVDGQLVWKGTAGMLAGTLEKEVVDSRVYKFDWSLFAEFQSGETLTGATVTSTPSGLTIATPALVPTQNLVTMRISGGTLGQTYDIECVVTTSGGNTISQHGAMAVTEP